MKKKVALTAAAVAMVGTLAVGGTLAWFTDTETATNIVTVGDVDVILSETGEGTPSEAEVDGLEYDNIMPGKTYAKKVVVNNVGTNDAYVKATITITAKDDNSLKLITDLKDGKDNAIELEDLAANGSWAYDVDAKTATYTVWYNGTATPDIFTADSTIDWTLFTGVNIPSTWDNSYEGVEFDIALDIEAIQFDNVTNPETELGVANTATNNNLDLNKENDEVGTVTAQ